MSIIAHNPDTGRRMALITSTHIDISDTPAPTPTYPSGWPAELIEALETGRISYRRACEIGGMA
jgi:hypothetical protein